MSTLYQLGALTIDSPGPFNADHVAEEFGADFAVKPVVGAQPPREFVGQADGHMTLSGTLFPFFYAKEGYAGGGLNELDMLRSMATAGEPQILVRGDGANLGWWLIEKVNLRSDKLSRTGLGKVQAYDISLVQSPSAASASSVTSLLTTLFTALAP